MNLSAQTAQCLRCCLSSRSMRAIHGHANTLKGQAFALQDAHGIGNITLGSIGDNNTCGETFASVLRVFLPICVFLHQIVTIVKRISSICEFLLVIRYILTNFHNIFPDSLKIALQIGFQLIFGILR